MTTKKDIEEYIKSRQCEEVPLFSVLLVENADKELVYPDGRRSGFPDFGNTYTAGFFYDIDAAVKAVETNACDIRETVYDAAFVLCLFPGLYETAGPNERIYFVWDEYSERYTQREEPKLVERISL